MEAASAPRKPNAPAAARQPYTAPATSPAPRTCFRGQDAHAVCARIPLSTLLGVRCSCDLCCLGSRPVGQCTCERAASENQSVSGATCPCGARPEASCTCEKAGAIDDALETDFTGR